MQDSAQLQISSSGTLQLDGSQRVDTFTLSDANGDPVIPNTRIVNDGVIEKLDTAVSGSAFSSLQASNLDLNGTISVIGGELAIDPLFFETFDEQSQTDVTLAEGVATFGNSSILTGGGSGVQLFGGQHVFAPGAAASGTLIANARVLEIQDDAATTQAEGLTVEVFESGFSLDVRGDGNLTILNTATLRGGMSGTGQTIIGTGAQATVTAEGLVLSSDRILQSDGNLGFVDEFGRIELQGSAQLQIGSTGTLQLDAGQFVYTFIPTDTNGDPIIPNTRIVNDGVIEKLNTAVSGSASSSLQASNLDLNGTIDVIGGELAIESLAFDTFDEQSQTVITLAEGVATYGNSSILTGGGDGVRLFGGQHVFAPGAAASGTLIADARVLEIQDDAATTPVEGLTVDVFENFGTVSGDGNLTILNTATLRNEFSGAGRTIIAAGAVATVDGFLRLEGDRVFQNDGTLGLLNEFDSIQLQDSAQLQIGSTGTLRLDGDQSVNTSTRFDANGDPINPNTRIVNDGRIEKLDTAERGSTFGSLSASTLDLNGTIEVVAGTLNIDALNTGFVDEAGFFVTTAEGVATYGSTSSLIGGDAGIQLSARAPSNSRRAPPAPGPSSRRADFRRRHFHRRHIDAERRHGRNGANHDRPRC